MGTDYVPLDNLMLSLINSKSYIVGTVVLKTPDLKEHFQALNTIIGNVLADFTKSMMADNSF